MPALRRRLALDQAWRDQLDELPQNGVLCFRWFRGHASKQLGDSFFHVACRIQATRPRANQNLRALWDASDMIRKLVIIVTACLGLGFLMLYAVWNAAESEPSERRAEPGAGRLQLDTAALGALSLTELGVAAGNERGELRLFSVSPLAETPQVYPLSQYAISAPVLENAGVLYVGDANGTFRAFERGKGVRWSYKTGNQITGGAVWCGGLVWVGSHDQTLYAFEPETGALRHAVECDGQINGTPVLMGDANALFLGNCDGKLRKIDMRTGAVSGELDFEAPIPDTPTLYDGMLYILTHQGRLAAVDAVTFDTRYQVELSETYFASPYATETFLFLTDTTGKIHVHSRQDGTRLATLPGNEKMTALRAGNDAQVYAVSSRGTLWRWRREADQWRETRVFDVQSDCRQSCVQFGNLLLIADTGGGLFYCCEEAP